MLYDLIKNGLNSISYNTTLSIIKLFYGIHLEGWGELPYASAAATLNKYSETSFLSAVDISRNWFPVS